MPIEESGKGSFQLYSFCNTGQHTGGHWEGLWGPAHHRRRLEGTRHSSATPWATPLASGTGGRVKSTCSLGTNSGMRLVVQTKWGCSITIILLLEGEVKDARWQNPQNVPRKVYDALWFTGNFTCTTSFDSHKSPTRGKVKHCDSHPTNREIQAQRLKAHPS